MKKFLALTLALIFVLMLASCGQQEVPDPTPSTTPSSNDTTNSSSSSSNPSDSENPDAPVTPPDEDTPLGPSDKDEPSVDITRPTVESVLGNVMDVFTAEDTYGNEGKISSYTDYTNVDVTALEGGKQYKIEKSGIYRITGKTANGQIYIKAKDQNVILLLDGVDITYAGSAPAIYAESCASVTIVLAEGSVNFVSDTNVNGEASAVRVRSCDLTLGGKGRLVVKGNAKHGISCTKNLIINGGSYNITAIRHGIYGKLSLTINGGKYLINSARSGFKSGDDEVGKEAEGKITINSCSADIRCNTNGINSYGTVEINDGRIQVEADGKAITATKDVNINGGTLIFKTAEDAIKSDQSINITGKANVKVTTNGNGIECVDLTVSTTGVIYIKTIPVFTEDVNGEYKMVSGEYVLVDGTETGYTKRYTLTECKGIEADNLIKISKATIGIDSYEDGFNSTLIEASSAKLVISTKKDAMDSSTNITLGGTIDVNIIDSNKGIKATNTVTINSGKTTISAETDAIKADMVSIVTGEHILYEKVEYVSNFTLRGGTLVCISTTNNPVKVKSTIPNASGTISHKDLCTYGQQLTVVMGTESVSITLPKDYSEKCSVLFAAECQSECVVIIGNNEKTETLTQGSFYS